MEVAVRKNYVEALEQQQIEVRQSVMDGLRQAREGKTKDFNAVCDRLEKKYSVVISDIWTDRLNCNV